MTITPYREGRDAFDHGASTDANPYDIRTHEAAHLDWEDGWLDAAERTADAEWYDDSAIDEINF